MRDLHVVTGGFGYLGKYIVRGLLARGRAVATLTNSPNRPNEFGENLTKEEVAGLTAGLLASNVPATGATRLSEWARQNRDTLGRRYASEMARRRDRKRGYGER